MSIHVVYRAQTLLNAAEIYDLDLGIEAALTEGLTFRAGAELIHHGYEDLAEAPILDPVPLAGNITQTVPDPSGAMPPARTFRDGSETRPLRTPDLTLNTAITYRIPVHDGGAFVRIAKSVEYTGLFRHFGIRRRETKHRSHEQASLEYQQCFRRMCLGEEPFQ
jgi:hypothetical protein